ncbi:MAG: SMC family ATPase, partial [Lachnospiraceae bacterium]|nr:SMC family ATPase [Lachnospiraceae bacterium]
MRPLILKMSGFGPYAEETVIPMEDLGEQGLYLITGDTGAGKTTIFDAICYALYGEASGPTREVSMFRSKYADPDTPTRVELTFLHNGKTYRIERNPEYYRPKKSGNGETKQTAGVNFYLPDGQVISKQGDVAKAVEDLLGLTRNQFSQISMLAQGDFLKLLLASTKDRQEIFRKIFQTDLYQKLQNEIDENRREVAFATERAQNSVKQYIQDITCDENDVLSQDLRRAKDGDMLITEVLELIAGIVEHDGESAGKSRELLSELQKQVEEVNRRIGELEILDKERINLENARRKMTVLTAQKEPLQLRLEHAKEAWGKKDEYTREAAKLEKELPDYEKAGNLKAETAKLEAELKRMQTGYAALSEEIKQKTELLQKAEQELEGLKNAGESLAKLKADEEKASLFQDQI